MRVVRRHSKQTPKEKVKISFNIYDLKDLVCKELKNRSRVEIESASEYIDYVCDYWYNSKEMKKNIREEVTKKTKMIDRGYTFQREVIKRL